MRDPSYNLQYQKIGPRYPLQFKKSVIINNIPFSNYHHHNILYDVSIIREDGFWTLMLTRMHQINLSKYHA